MVMLRKLSGFAFTARRVAQKSVVSRQAAGRQGLSAPRRHAARRGAPRPIRRGLPVPAAPGPEPSARLRLDRGRVREAVGQVATRAGAPPEARRSLPVTSWTDAARRRRASRRRPQQTRPLELVHAQGHGLTSLADAEAWRGGERASARDGADGAGGKPRLVGQRRPGGLGQPTHSNHQAASHRGHR